MPDPDHLYREVLLAQEVSRPRLGPPFEWRNGAWHLEFGRADVDRMEYLLAIDGRFLPDPANPLRAPGPYGDKSVVEWPGYEAPAWLDSVADAGPVQRLEIRCRRLVARVHVLLYSTPDPPGLDAPLLVAHDGPEFAEFAGLTRYLDVMSWEERIPPLNAALIQPVDRNETYSASALYAAALARELLPEIAKHVPHKRRIGMGASLGGLAMLHAHRRHPRLFDGLLLQSSSFFRQRFDKQESTFPRYRRITRFVGTVLRGLDGARPIPVAITCGTAEENRSNNEAVAAALRAQGYPAWVALVRDAHNWTCWRDAFDPHLPAVIEAAHVNRRVVDIDGGSVVAYGHYGRPLVAFPSENGEPYDWEDRGMVEAIAPLLDAGRVKLYCIPSFDRDSWTRGDLPLEERARRHGHYEWWVLTKLVPFVQADSHAHELIAAGASFGAYHSVNICLKRADLFPLAIGMSGVYDVTVQGGGERGEAVYFNNPMDYVANLHGDHLNWLRRQASVVLVCGQGQWEDTTGALDSTRRFGALLAEKGISHEVDLWGHDVPHDWPSWRRQLAHHLPRFVL